MDSKVDNSRTAVQILEAAARNVENAYISDNSVPTLLDVMNVIPHMTPTSSGAGDIDYPNLTRLPPAFSNIPQVKLANKIPLPSEILERFNHIQCHSMMGLFTEMDRAWLTIDSDIYIWLYEEGGDVAYYDGLNETILCVGLITPKPNVFQNFIKYLLILTTATDIVVLGVMFVVGSNDQLKDIQFVAEPVFTLPTDGSTITTIVGTTTGRIFLGSKEGSLFEIVYQAESSWFGKRCKKINHSTSTLSYLMPSFLNAAFSDDDSILQISIDNSRHILFVLTEKGSILVYDLGESGNSFSNIYKLSQASLVSQAMNAVKTLDSQTFRPIITISAVDASESAHINLVAVSQTGVRFYFTVVGLSNLQPNHRPYTLTLVHVRLPPGFSNVVTTRPRMVHMAEYKGSNLMLLSSVNDRDVLWCITSDMFPFASAFIEAHTTISMDGPAWAMAEVLGKKSFLEQQPCVQDAPLVVRQHFEPPRKFIVLTTQGAHIFTKLRPVDILNDLLLECRGPDNEAVKTFYSIQKEEQACATSLILACLESVQNADVLEWATRAFFIYGGEPKVAPPLNINQTNTFVGPTSFLPNVMSTPVSPQMQMRQQLQANSSVSLDQSQPTLFPTYSPFIFSPKHNGLYLYLERILRPVWNMNCVQKLVIPGIHKLYLTSMLSGEDCTFILSYLNALRVFLQRNTRLTVCNPLTEQNPYQTFQTNQQTINTTRLNQTSVQDAQLEERQSLDAFKSFVNHCSQVMGLWRILSEHQFHILVESLPPNHQQMLQSILFKDLFLYGHEVCIDFINVLVRSYLNDNALIDSISSKLREVCPDLYKNEDAACSKAYEMLKSAKTVQNPDEKEELITSALHLCKSVAPNINIHELCQQFASLNAYHAITDLCVTCAKKIDPENVAEYYYRNNETPQQDSYTYYANRMKIYKEVLQVLDNLNSQIAPQDIATDISLGAQVQNMSLQQEKIDMIRRVIVNILSFQDELLHVAIYEWMMAKQMNNDILKINQSSLEKYLIRASQQAQDDITALDLLWKYYQSNNNPSSAAKILYNLANKPRANLALKERVSYLARAVMCMRSDRVGYAPHLGVFLKDIEDKLDVARIQEEILNAITNIGSSNSNTEQAIIALNSGLYDLSQLYEEFCDPFNLWECKLAIIECAGHSDTALIENIWHHIIEDELNKSSGYSDNKMSNILSKVTSLIERYKTFINCVPLDYIVERLEIISLKLKASPKLVPEAICSEVPMEAVVQVYNNLICASTTDQFWSLGEHEFHLAEAFAELVNTFICNCSSYDHHLRIKIKATCEDVLAKLFTTLYTKPNAGQLINMLKTIQSQLARL